MIDEKTIFSDELPAAQKPVAEPGIALCLSGGGFRATLFTLGSVWRLNEFGLLPKLNLITSVSGGSILSGLLGLRWNQLRFDVAGVATNFSSVIAVPIREFCSQKIAVPAAIGGLLNPFKSIGDEMTEAYEALFGKATLQDLPAPPAPLFMLYATSLQTGRSVRMCRRYLADYLVGLLPSPNISLARAVAASSAFPPILSPQEIKTDPLAWQTTKGATLTDPQWRKKLILTDGGVYDNMGLEAAWDRYQTVLVCDAGAPFKYDAAPADDWIRQPVRAMDIMTDQTRALRKRWLVRDFIDGKRDGTYWGIRTSIGDYAAPGISPIVHDSPLSQSLATIRTHLDPFTLSEQGHLINWGYALCDAAIRRHADGLGKTIGQQPIPEHSL